MKRIRVFTAVLCAKAIYVILRALGRNAGSSPGFVAMRIFPDLLRHLSADADVTLVTGTNGKTTTTKMIVEIMDAAGMQVICNTDGANMLQGIATRVALNCNWRCRLRYKYIVMECDELYFARACKDMRPRRILIKDICKDQTDRLGSIADVEKMINRGVRMADSTAVFRQKDNRALFTYSVQEETEDHIAFDAITPNGTLSVTLNVPGVYNVANAIDAISVAQHLGISNDAIQQGLARMTPCEGRQHTFIMRGVPMRMILVKNPSSFNAAIQYLYNIKEAFQLVIIINDTEADGRDVSWLSEVDFRQLSEMNIKRILVSGTRSADVVRNLMASDIHADLITEITSPDTLYELVLQQQAKTVWLPNYSAMWNLLHSGKKNQEKWIV